LRRLVFSSFAFPLQSRGEPYISVSNPRSPLQGEPGYFFVSEEPISATAADYFTWNRVTSLRHEHLADVEELNYSWWGSIAFSVIWVFGVNVTEVRDSNP